jgi:hypothetical protein
MPDLDGHERWIDARPGRGQERVHGLGVEGAQRHPAFGDGHRLHGV